MHGAFGGTRLDDVGRRGYEIRERENEGGAGDLGANPPKKSQWPAKLRRADQLKKVGKIRKRVS